MKNKIRNLFIATSVSISVLTTISQAQDSKIDLTTHGRLSLGYFGNNGSFTGNNNAPGLFGLNAHIMANFGLNEN